MHRSLGSKFLAQSTNHYLMKFAFERPNLKRKHLLRVLLLVT